MRSWLGPRGQGYSDIPVVAFFATAPVRSNTIY